MPTPPPPEQMSPEDWARDPRSTLVPRHSILALNPSILTGDLFPEELLARYSAAELAGLAMVVGIPHSGSKAEKCRRIVAGLRLRERLARATPASLVEHYTRAQLREFAGIARSFRGGSKRQLATGLINWRDRCRHMGVKALAEGHQFSAALAAIEDGRPVHAWLVRRMLKPSRRGRWLTEDMIQGYTRRDDLYVCDGA